SECGKTTLVRDFRKRIRLIHKLRKLRRAEKLTDGCRYRFRVNEVARHRRVHILLDRHFFLDGAFHSLKSDAELIFQKLADGADASISQMVDVVLRIMLVVFLHSQKIVNYFKEISGF